MSQYERMVRKLDKSWQGLFQALQGKERQLCEEKERQLYCGEEWIRDAMSCDYIERPDWTVLLSGLLSKEPLFTNGQIIMRPLFCHLPSNIQKYLISIFYHHRRSIDVGPLREFVLKVKDIEVKDTWVQKLVTMLEDRVDTDDQCRLYQLSDKNKEKYMYLLQTLKQSGQGYLPLQKDQTQTRLEVSRDENSPELFDVTISDEEEQDLTDKDADTKELVDGNDDDVIFIEDEDDDQDEGDRKSSPRKRQVDDKSNIDDFKKLKKESDCVDESPVLVQRCNMEESVSDHLDSDLKVKLSKLHELWRNGDKNYPDHFDVFINSSSDQVKLMCEYMKMEEESDEYLETACDHLMSKTTDVSYTNCSIFLTYAIKPKFSGLVQTPSRTLVNVMLNLCQTFPKQMMDILTDVITDQPINTCQGELLSRFCLETFGKRDNEYWMSKIVARPRCLEEPVVSVLQSLIDRKVDLSSDVTSNLIGCLSLSRVQLSNSQKFGKFLLHFINKYGKQLESAELPVIALILDCHTTFLKKSAQIAFKKLSK